MSRIQDPERFKNIASGIQSIAVAIAVVVGGIWTLYTFGAQLQVANSRAQLKALERQLELKPRINAQITLKQLPVTKAARYIVSGAATIENSGTDAYLAVFAGAVNHRPPITLYSVAFDANGLEQWTLISRHDLVYSEDSALSSTVVDTETKATFEFVTAVKEPGIYAAALNVGVNPREQKNLSDAQKKQLASSVIDQLFIGATTYIVVEEPTSNSKKVAGSN